MTTYITPYLTADYTIWESAGACQIIAVTDSLVYDTAWVTLGDIPSGDLLAAYVGQGLFTNRDVISGTGTSDPLLLSPVAIGSISGIIIVDDTDHLLGIIDVVVAAPALGYLTKLTWTDGTIFSGGTWLTPSAATVPRAGVRCLSASLPTTFELLDTWTLTIVLENTLGPTDTIYLLGLAHSSNMVVTSQVFDGVSYPLGSDMYPGVAMGMGDQKTLVFKGTFNASGPGDVRITIQDDTGVTGPDEAIYLQNLTVNAPIPTSSISCTPSAGAPPLSVTCFASGGNGVSVNPPTSYAWNFGDGNVSAAASPVHVFTVEGLFTVSVVMTFDSGPNVSTSRTVKSSYTPPFTIPRNHFLASTPTNVAVSFSLNSPDPLGEFTYTILDAPDHGSVLKTGSDATYTPNSGYFGYDSFTFEITDGVTTSQVLKYNIVVLKDVGDLERIAWVFTDADGYYPWPTNPDTSTSGSVKRAFAYEVVTRETFSTLEARESAEIMAVSGVLFTQAEYDAFETWYAKGHAIFLIDDLQRVFKVFMTKFTPERAGSANKPWRHKYSMDLLVLGEV